MMRTYYFFYIFLLVGTLAYGQGSVYQVTFNDLEAGANYIDSAAVGDVLFTEDSVEVRMVDAEVSIAASYLATDVFQCTMFRADLIHMFFGGGLEFDTRLIDQEINYCEFLYDWDCAEDGLEIEIDDLGSVLLEDDEEELIINNEIYITRFEDFVAITGPLERVTLSGLEVGVDNVTFRQAEEDCHILDLTSRQNCSGPNQQFFSTLSFDYVGTSDSFNVYVNGAVYDIFAYADVPVQIGPFAGDNTTIYNYDVEDKFDTQCRASTSIGTVLCTEDDCELTNGTVDVGDCTNSRNYPIRIDFDIDNPQGSFYDVNGSQGYIGFFRYQNVPETIMFPNSENDEEFVIVSDAKSPLCADTIYFDRPNCPEEENCVINTMDLSIRSCLDTTFMIVVDLVAENNSDFFDLAVGIGDFTEYEYDSLPITIGPFPADSMTNYSITVIDRDSPGCNITRRVRPVACGLPRCNITDVRLITTECRGEVVDALLDFEASAGTSDSFTLLINNFPQGNFPYTITPLALDPLLGDGSTYQIGVRDINNECDNFWQTGSIFCPPCNLDLVRVDPGDCRSDRTIPITIDLDITNVTSPDFTLRTSTGFEAVYRYVDLPITFLYPIDLDVDEDIITIFDNNNNDCGDSFTLNLPDCRNEWCNITGMVVEQRACTGNSYGVNLDFRFRNTGDRFRVRGENGTLGVFNYTDLPVAVGPFTAEMGRIYRITVEDIANPESCRDTLDFESFECMTTSIDNIAAQNISVYPVPARDQIFINTAFDLGAVQVYNMQGQQVLSSYDKRGIESNERFTYELATGALNTGVYMLHLLGIDGERAQARLMIE